MEKKKRFFFLVWPMSGVESLTGNMSPTIVAKIVIDSIMATPVGGEKGSFKWKV